MAILNTLDMAQVEAHIEHLSAVTLREAARHGLPITSPLDPRRKGSNTAIRVNDSASVERCMADAGFIVSARGAVIRIAPHFYNTEQDVAGAVAALARIV